MFPWWPLFPRLSILISKSHPGERTNKTSYVVNCPVRFSVCVRIILPLISPKKETLEKQTGFPRGVWSSKISLCIRLVYLILLFGNLQQRTVGWQSILFVGREFPCQKSEFLIWIWPCDAYAYVSSSVYVLSRFCQVEISKSLDRRNLDIAVCRIMLSVIGTYKLWQKMIHSFCSSRAIIVASISPSTQFWGWFRLFVVYTETTPKRRIFSILGNVKNNLFLKMMCILLLITVADINSLNP